MQGMYRGRKARQKVGGRREGKRIRDRKAAKRDKEDKAATKLQATFRGHRTRKGGGKRGSRHAPGRGQEAVRDPAVALVGPRQRTEVETGVARRI